MWLFAPAYACEYGPHVSGHGPVSAGRILSEIFAVKCNIVADSPISSEAEQFRISSGLPSNQFTDRSLHYYGWHCPDHVISTIRSRIQPTRYTFEVLPCNKIIGVT